jgi:ubiquinone/menaquinone biosynthesis C-methylase UbiE
MKEALKNFWSSDADSYNKAIKCTLNSVIMRKSWQKIFIEVLGDKKLKILDVGTGPGIVALMLAELGHDVTGVDLSDDMLKNALRNRETLGISVDFRRGDAEHLPFNDESYDAVVNRYVLWTVLDPKTAVNEWKRVLKPGGKIVIVDGNWYANENSMKRMLWRAFSSLLVMITERKNPLTCDLDPKLKNKLWSIKANRPDADRRFLEQSGFKDIYVIDKINQRTNTTIEHLKYGYQGDTFLITATKA